MSDISVVGDSDEMELSGVGILHCSVMSIENSDDHEENETTLLDFPVDGSPSADTAGLPSTSRPTGIETDLQCQVCQKMFKRKDNLRRHGRIHSGQKVPCDICKREFIDRYELQRHKNRVHNPGVVYRCDVCDKEYKTLVGRDKHKQIHSGKYRYLGFNLPYDSIGWEFAT